MKLTNTTLAILKNYAAINNSIWINKGNVLKTITTPTKNIFAVAVVQDTFPEDFGIYDLNKFLGVLSLHKDSPELTFESHQVKIGGLGGRSKVSYRYTAKDMITAPPDKTISIADPELTFTLEEDDYIWIINAAKTLQSPNISVVSDGETVSLMTWDSKNDSVHSETLEIGKVSDDKSFNPWDFRFNTDYWTKIVPGTYKVKITTKGLAHFKHAGQELDYFIALEKKPVKIED